MPAARARGIVATNTPDVLTEAVAEFTWGLILGIARRVAEGDRLIRAGNWKRWGLDFMLGMELRGKQLGIVGGGRIGRAVAAKAPAFGMKTVFAGRQNRSDPSGSGQVSLDELLVTSDVVSLSENTTLDGLMAKRFTMYDYNKGPIPSASSTSKVQLSNNERLSRGDNIEVRLYRIATAESTLQSLYPHNLFGTMTTWITTGKSIRKCCSMLPKLSWEFLGSIGHFLVNQKTRSGGCN